MAYLQVKERNRKAAAQEKLDFAEQFVELEKRETGAFWNCVMASEVDVGMFQKAEQFQQRIESAYFTQQKTFSDYLTTECVPKIERARQAFGGLRDAPPELAGPIDKYRETLPKLQSGLEDYAENIKKRGTIKDADQLIQETGNAWHSTPDPTPEAVAFEKFLYCAVPGLAKMKDAQALLEFMADQCFKKDPVAFMDKVRADCGSLLNRRGQGSQGQSQVGPHLEDHPQAVLRGGRAPAPGLGELWQAVAQGQEEGRAGELPPDRQRLHGRTRGRGQRRPGIQEAAK